MPCLRTKHRASLSLAGPAFVLLAIAGSAQDPRVNEQSGPETRSQSEPTTRSRSRRGRQPRNDRNSGNRNSRAETFRDNVPPHPYDIVLGRPTASSVTVSLLVYSSFEGLIEYGTEEGTYNHRTEVFRLTNDQPRHVELSGLRPNSTYFYRLLHRPPGAPEFEASTEFRFHTQRAPGEPFVFTVQADPHLDDRTNTRLYEASLKNAAASLPDFHIDLGDTFMTDKRRADFREALPQYLAQRYYFGLIGASTPVFLISGNHDGESRARGAMGEWARRQRRKYFATPSDEFDEQGNYYAWNWGDALFVALDPFWATQRRRGGSSWDRTLGDEQYQWLRETLEQSEAKFKFVFIHHLVGGKDQAVRGGVATAGFFEWGGRDLDGVNRFEEQRPGWTKPIHQLLVDTGVTILFHGHDHLFAKEELDGVIYQLVPQPGIDRYGAPRSVEEYGYIPENVIGGPGILRVQVSAEETQVDLVRPYVDGQGHNGETVHSYKRKRKP